MKLTRYRTALVLVGALAAAFLALAIAQASPRTGDKAPGFKLTSITGKTLDLGQIRRDPANEGKSRVVVLNFWATWCPYCVEDLPVLQGLHEKYAKRGVAIVGTSVDSDGVSVVKPFVKQHKLTYSILSDPEASVARQYGVRGYPTTFIIDKKGVVRYVHIGAVPGMDKQMDREIQTLIKE